MIVKNIDKIWDELIDSAYYDLGKFSWRPFSHHLDKNFPLFDGESVFDEDCEFNLDDLAKNAADWWQEVLSANPDLILVIDRPNLSSQENFFADRVLMYLGGHRQSGMLNYWQVHSFFDQSTPEHSPPKRCLF